jgi:endonuclease-3 related protein
MPQANTNLSNTAFLKIYKTLYKTFGPQYWWPGETPFEIIVGAILTQNTNWYNASRAIENIKIAGLLDPKKLLKERRKIPHLIKTSGFYRMKSRYLCAFLEHFVTNYDGRVEKMAEMETRALRRELLSIQGIGPETADAILLYALGKRIFVVDGYTRRIFSRHGMVEPDVSYGTLQDKIENNLPKNTRIYNEFHALLVRAGKEYCRKNEPLCTTCPLGELLSRA